MFKKRIIALLISSVFMFSLMTGCVNGNSNSTTASTQTTSTDETRTFTDSSGRELTLKGEATKIAALRGSSYDKCLFFGKAANVAVAASKNKWANKVFPEFNPIVADDPQNPNVEDLAKKGIDLVLFWNTKDVIKKLEDTGIPVVVGSDENYITVKSPEDFKNWIKNDMTVYAQAIGGDGNLEKAKKWCDYCEKVYDKITSATSKLSKQEIPDVYYIRGPEITKTHAGKSITRWYITMAGGHLVTENIDDKIADVNVEQINTWNPDYIFMGRLKSIDPIVNSKDFTETKAVKNGKVYLNPCGVFEWDYGTEGVLFVQWLAKTMHPDLFQDIDIEKEIKWYYKEFYNYTLTDNDVKCILNNMDPEE